jgi:hypothetical protein
VLISYLADRSFGGLSQLSISMNDTNRVLVAFDLPEGLRAAALGKAELVLDLKNPERYAATEPFELALHPVSGEWSETGTSWKSQPAFIAEPAVTLTLDPHPHTVRIDVTALTRRWLARDLPNHGILLKVAAVTNQTAREGQGIPPSSEEPPALTFPFAEPQVEKLPWPHQEPGLSKAAVDELNREVWIINDFPLYQADRPGRWRYFHGGLDIVLDNGTKIRAMKDGWVKAIFASSIVIGDARGDEPGYGWSYSHLGNHQVEVGEFVKQGSIIGEVDFHGLAHLHLERVFSEGPHWGSWHYISVPNGHFTYRDADPPVVETPFHFFPNRSDREIEPSGSGPIRLCGEVDIVVGMREAGSYARSEGGFGDRLGVMRMDYEIAPLRGGKARRFRSFDFGRLKIRKGVHARAYGTALTKVVYKHYGLFERERKSGSQALSYYVITNCRGDEPPSELALDDVEHAWDTAARDRQGKPLYPDGRYRITVTARDFDGHQARATMTVIVANGG